MASIGALDTKILRLVIIIDQDKNCELSVTREVRLATYLRPLA